MENLIPDATPAERKKRWQPVKRNRGGWLFHYQELVAHASQAGILL